MRGATPNLGLSNVLIGDTTSPDIGASARDNVIIGAESAKDVTGTVVSNTIIGSSVWTNGESGNRNVFIGCYLFIRN